MSAFSSGCNQECHGEFVEIGKKIVAKCHSVPLAIKVVGSLLFGQDVQKWESFEQSGLATNGEGNNRIMSILMLSYHNLESSLKSCFSYCAVFPKDHEIEKGVLIELWMAQGYIVPLEGGQSIDDAAEEHFVILLRRCFFQDVMTDDCGDIYSIKIHDLMHDVAQEVGKEEARVVTAMTNYTGDKIRHFEILPDSIGNLLHLRFLDLSHNSSLEILPDAITRLHNLQTLNLGRCNNLRELPKDFSKLVNLWHLDIHILSNVTNLSGMPSGLDKLSSLRVLTYFVVGNRNSSDVDELKALKPLINLKGSITIKISEYYNNRKVVGMNNGVEGRYLKSMKYLTGVVIKFSEKQGGCVRHEAVLEVLEPPSNIKILL
uniref:Uncharacterized protein n=1 Tax=Chenopodium quinoa TaxID=63459 RepID=A0A803N6M8_CHEQI